MLKLCQMFFHLFPLQEVLLIFNLRTYIYTNIVLFKGHVLVFRNEACSVVGHGDILH